MRGRKATPEHGTRACYRQGCRRPECREAQRVYSAECREARRPPSRETAIDIILDVLWGGPHDACAACAAMDPEVRDRLRA